jgi:hypothetical protein
VLEGLQLTSPVAVARKELATELLGDLCRLDDQMKELRQRLAGVVAASGTTTTKVFDVGPVIAAMVVGLTGNVRRFPSRAHFGAYNATAPIEVSQGKEAVPSLHEGQPPVLTTPCTWSPLPRSATLGPRAAPTTGASWPKTRRAKKHYGRSKRRISDSLYAAMVADAAKAKDLAGGGPGGQTGNGSLACAAGSHPAKPALRPSHSRAKAKPRTAHLARTPQTPKKTRKTS